jgi:hypothetical protein
VLRRYISGGTSHQTTPSEMATLLDDDDEIEVI